MKKTEADSIIDSLAKKTLSFGQKVKTARGIETVVRSWAASPDYVHPDSDWKGGYEVVSTIFNDTHYYEEYRYSHKMKGEWNGKKFEILGHEIMLGNILEKLMYTKSFTMQNVALITRRWGECLAGTNGTKKTGLTKSLQQIIAESGYEEIEHYRGEQEPLMEQVLKSPAKELLENIKALIDLLK